MTATTTRRTLLDENILVYRVSDEALEAAAGSIAGKSEKTDANSGWCCGDQTVGTVCGG